MIFSEAGMFEDKNKVYVRLEDPVEATVKVSPAMRWGLGIIDTKIQLVKGCMFYEDMFLEFGDEYLAFQVSNGNLNPTKNPEGSMRSNILGMLVKGGYLAVETIDKVSGMISTTAPISPKRDKRDRYEMVEDMVEVVPIKKPKQIEHVFENNSTIVKVIPNEDTFTVTVTQKPLPIHLELPDYVLKQVREEFGGTFLNPPLNDIGPCIQKLCESVFEVAVAIVPAHVDSDWFHNWVLGKAEVRCIKQRFGNMPCMLIVYRKAKNGLLVAPGPLSLQVFHSFKVTDKLALTFVNSIRSEYENLLKTIKLIIDPNCGNGAFIRAFDGFKKKIYGIDSDPKIPLSPTILKMDFVKEFGNLNSYSKDQVLCFGCPPANLASEYVNKCADFSDNIFMFVPKGTIVNNDTLVKRSFVCEESTEFAHYQRCTGIKWRFVDESEQRVNDDIAIYRNATQINKDVVGGQYFIVRFENPVDFEALSAKIIEKKRLEPYRMEEMTLFINEALEVPTIAQ